MGAADISFAAKSALIGLRPQEARITWEVSGHLDLSLAPHADGWHGRGPLARTVGYLGRPRRRTDEVWAVSVVRDEADVIAYTVEHLLAEGVDRLVVADNGSTDETPGILRKLAVDLPVTVLDDALQAHHQGVKMTRLARYAARAGAAWVVPFDADELWYSLDGRPLAETLRAADCAIAVASMWNHLPDFDQDDAAEPNPYLRMHRRTADPLGFAKVAFRAHPWARLVHGNHNVRRQGARERLLGIRQVPYRTVEQIERKYRQGAAALEATGIGAEMGTHWRERARMSTADMVATVLAEGAEHGFVEDPAPFRGLAEETP